MKVKICGITNTEDAMNAVSLGADALGFIFSDRSPRQISPDLAEEIIMELPPFINVVGVFVDQPKDDIEAIVKHCNLDLIQLHGRESTQFCMALHRPVIKAFKVAELEDIEAIGNYQGMVSAALLDTKVKDQDGGTGKTFDWGIALQAKEHNLPIILAGGINGENVEKAIQLVNPYAIDVCSGVEETIGKKDYNKLKTVIEIAKGL